MKMEISTTETSIRVVYKNKEYHYSTAMIALMAIRKILYEIEDESGIREDPFHPSNISNKQGYIKSKPKVKKVVSEKPSATGVKKKSLKADLPF